MTEPSLVVRDPVTNYEKIKRIGEGTYGVVCELPSRGYLVLSPASFLYHSQVSEVTLFPIDKARDRTTGEIVALKQVRMQRERDGEEHIKLVEWCVPENKSAGVLMKPTMQVFQ